MEAPFFTIIIPTLDRAHMIRTAIESVLGQKDDTWELLIIDNGSVDDTKSVVSGYDDARIQYHRHLSDGRSGARNHGLSLARGRWVCFLDSDDYYLSDHLEVFKKQIELHPCVSVIKTGVIFRDTAGREIVRSNAMPDTEQERFVLRHYCSVLDLCIRMDVAQQCSFPHFERWEDKAYLLHLLDHTSIHQIAHHTVVAIDHSDRSVKTAHLDIDQCNHDLTSIKSFLEARGVNDSTIDDVLSKQVYSVLYAYGISLDASIKGVNLLHSQLHYPLSKLHYIRLLIAVFWKKLFRKTY